MFWVLLTHAKIWTLILVIAGMSAVAQLVQPVVFGCNEEVPRQQGADAHQEEDDVNQTVRVLWTVAHSQRHWWMFGKKTHSGTLFVVLLILRRKFMGKSRRTIWGVYTVWYFVAHFSKRNKNHLKSKDGSKEHKTETYKKSDKAWVKIKLLHLNHITAVPRV